MLDPVVRGLATQESLLLIQRNLSQCLQAAEIRRWQDAGACNLALEVRLGQHPLSDDAWPEEVFAKRKPMT